MGFIVIMQNKRLVRLWIVLLAVLLLPAQIGRAAGPVARQGTLTVIGRGMGSPDDLAVDASDTIYFGDMTVSRVVKLNAKGEPEIVSPIIHEPEGIVPLPDGTLVVVEQATNRLYQLDPVAKTMSLFYDIGNKTRNMGVDGLSRDPISGDILIPDSATGRILRLTSDARQLTVIASGFKRPTAVALASDGTLYICDEYGYAIFRMPPGGKPSLVAKVPIPDDVLIDSSGGLIVNSLQGVIWHIDPRTGKKTELVTGLQSPHGIALDSQGNLIIADAGRNQIYKLTLPHKPATPASQS